MNQSAHLGKGTHMGNFCQKFVTQITNPDD